MSSNIWLEFPQSRHDRNLHKLPSRARLSKRADTAFVGSFPRAHCSTGCSAKYTSSASSQNRTAELLRGLRRKPWTSNALSAAFELSVIHYLSHSPEWIPPELHDEVPTVIINFNRDCRVWPPGAADSAFSQLLSDNNSGTDSILVATDGSFDPATNRAGWDFAIFGSGELIQQGAGAHHVFTSSTRMELEAVRNALKAVKDIKAPPTIIVATDSMAILCKIQSGYLPGEWFDLRDAHPTTNVIWVFVPGHSGVTGNETADMLAASCSNFTPLDVFPSDLKLMGAKSWKDQLTTSIQSWEEGRHLIFLGISLGSSLFSTRAGRAKAIHNHLLTGNISYSTLLMLLGGHVDGERIGAAAHPQWTLFAKAKQSKFCLKSKRIVLQLAEMRMHKPFWLVNLLVHCAYSD